MSNRHEQRVREEIANSVTHGAGLLLSLAGFVVLLMIAMQDGDGLGVMAVLIYGTCLVGLYLASTMYHATHQPRRKHSRRLLDHCAIYLLIAGSYTPFLLLVLPPAAGWTLFGVIWICAVAGILMKILYTHRATRLSTISYLLMGWVSLLAIKPLYDRLPPLAFWLLVSGGIAYTSGTWFFVRDNRRYFHAVWHLFVLAGSACHFAAITRVLYAGI